MPQKNPLVMLTKKVARIERQLFESDFYKNWQKHSPNKINLNSGTALGNYLYDVLKLKPAKLTETGKGATDEEALSMLQIPELTALVNRSKLQKARDTYLDAFYRESVNETLHPVFNLHLTKTYRSSSSNPNFQNIPKRDKETMKLVRNAIYPRKGHQLLEFDYKGIEVVTAACYHKDGNMLKYLTDKTSDMHGDMAKQIFKIPDFNKKIPEHGVLRSAAKNGFVFPQFYGDYYKNNAEQIFSGWIHLPAGKLKKDQGILLPTGHISNHFLSNGISSLTDFISHIQKIETDFWSNRFPEYAAWKERHYSTYLKYGYVTTLTGFTVQGVMSRNDVINYPIQGSAFHLLLWLFSAVDAELQARKMQSRLVGQIHDALVLDIYPPELQEVYDLVTHLGTVVIRNVFPWIIVPLELEAEICPVDGSWANKSEWKPETAPF